MYRLTALSLRHPLAVSIGIALITIVLGSALPRLQTEYGVRVLLGGEHPAIQRLETVVDRYGGGFPAFIVWRCGEGAPCETVFDPVAIQMAEDIEESLRSSEAIRGVLSPATATLLIPSEDGFAATTYVDIPPDASGDQAAFVARALEDPMWVGQIVSEDARTGAIVALTSDVRSATLEIVTDAVERSVARYETEGWVFHLAGSRPKPSLPGATWRRAQPRSRPSSRSSWL